MALLGRLRRRDSSEPTRPHCPEGLRVYAVGDIHGRADLLGRMHESILSDADGFDGEKRVVYLGDFIDRGMDSRRVMEMLIEHPLPGFESIHLMGNHEHALLSFLEDPGSIPGWLGWGGRETLYSYGIRCGLSPSPDELESLGRELAITVPADHVRLMENCVLFHRAGSYYFVHAGIRPGVPLVDQRFEDQLWIREPFISSPADHGAIVVHGHTIAEQVQPQPNRIGIDTGAYYSDVLTCLVVEGEEQRLIQTGAPS